MNVFEKIGNTPMIQYHGEVPNGNRIYFKLECENPFGSHYDRVYPALYKHYEEKGRLVPGATVLETTSGSAGVSFAGIGRRLGYKCIVAIPACTENAREEAIKQEGAELINTPADVYVKGFPPFLKRYLVKNRHVIFLNHSMGEFGIENTVTTSSLESIAVEAQKKLGSIDYYVAAVGNGSTVLGPGRIFAAAGTKIVTFESLQSGVAYEYLYPGAYERAFGIKPGSLPRHNLFGTSYPGITFPHIQIALQKEQLVSETFLVSDAAVDQNYYKATGKETPLEIPRWDAYQLRPYGRTTRAGLAVALKIAEREHNKKILALAYDNEDRYD
ncbi:MAG: pyridoxal-phosphate dependent enzyme [Patescibacteria group bacterium]